MIQLTQMLSENKTQEFSVNLQNVSAIVPRDGFTEIYLPSGEIIKVKETYSEIRAKQTQSTTKQKQVLKG